MPDTSESAAVAIVEPDDSVLSDDLPGWAERGSTAREHRASTGSSSGNWLKTALNGETSVPGPSEVADADGASGSTAAGLEITVCRTVCGNCGQSTVRRVHKGCGEPIIQQAGTWRCGGCGAEAKQAGHCPECGGTVRHEPVTIPLALAVDLRPGELERAIHQATNDRRSSHGIGSLEYSDPISAIALQHSRDMAQRGYFSHYSPEGADVRDRYQVYGHQAGQCGENLAKVYPAQDASLTEAAQDVVDTWMNSPGHRENLLREEFEREGIGVYLGQDGAVYATQNFE